MQVSIFTRSSWYRWLKSVCNSSTRKLPLFAVTTSFFLVKDKQATERHLLAFSQDLPFRSCHTLLQTVSNFVLNFLFIIYFPLLTDCWQIHIIVMETCVFLVPGIATEKKALPVPSVLPCLAVTPCSVTGSKHKPAGLFFCIQKHLYRSPGW